MTLATLYDGLAQHPHLAGFAVFLISMAESLAVVGLIIPGVAMMFAIGALVGAGALSFEPVCAYAIAGAIAGDGLSFWLGQHYRDRLRQVWPFNRHPAMIQRGEDFFRRYGGRSIVFGRFVGPIRAVIPVVAGMMDMAAGRFLWINILSAVLWAPAYLLPGVAFGASLDLASEVAGRLAVLLVAIVAALWFAAWTSKRFYLFVRPRAYGLILFSFEFSRRHPLFARLTVPLIDPSQRDYPGLLVWATLLGGSALLVCRLMPADLIPISLEPWRHPWSDYVMTVWAEAGSTESVTVFLAVVGAWLLIRRQGMALAHFWVAGGFALLLGMACRRVAPVPLVDTHVLNGAVVYGFGAVLLAENAAAGRRGLIYSLATLLLVVIGLARIYSGTGQFLAVCFSLVLASAWLVLVGVAYRRHRQDGWPVRGLTWVAPLGFGTILVALWSRHSVEEFRYQAPIVEVSEAGWIARDFADLPAWRVRTFGRPNQALAVQWAGSLDDIHATLSRLGWREAKPWRAATVLNFLNPTAALPELPVLPHFNQTEADALRMIAPGPGARWLIVRFWASGWVLAPGSGSQGRDHSKGEEMWKQPSVTNPPKSVPVWLASVGVLRERGFLGLLTFSTEFGGDGSASELLAGQLGEVRRVIPAAAGEGRTVLLVPP